MGKDNVQQSEELVHRGNASIVSQQKSIRLGEETRRRVFQNSVDDQCVTVPFRLQMHRANGEEAKDKERRDGEESWSARHSCGFDDAVQGKKEASLKEGVIKLSCRTKLSNKGKVSDCEPPH